MGLSRFLAKMTKIAKKWQSPTKKIARENFFRYRIFTLKTFWTFWIDSEQKNLTLPFLPKKSLLWPFSSLLCQNQNTFFAQFYCGYFKPSSRSLPSKMCKRNNFVRFLPNSICSPRYLAREALTVKFHYFHSLRSLP